jgi:methylated-DNA-protein-cysteine methyltransferase related protein
MHPPSDVYRGIWDAVLRIPKRRVATYGRIARMCGFPRQARLVGYALHSLPSGANIPWHRVVSAKGRISLPRRHGHHQTQKTLLEKEGVVFVRDRINLSIYGWPKPKISSK